MVTKVRDGKCAICGRKRGQHEPNGEGLGLVCPNGSGTTFRWAKSAGRASASFSAEEIRLLDIAVAQAMGGPVKISATNPRLVELRRKTLSLKKRVAEEDA